jgi:hypothetical protein
MCAYDLFDHGFDRIFDSWLDISVVDYMSELSSCNALLINSATMYVIYDIDQNAKSSVE